MEFKEFYEEPYDLEMSYMPPEKYVSMQNPPNFTWPKDYDAVSYNIIICSDRNLNKICYQKEAIPNNYYNFETTMNTGVDYYWSVCAVYADGTIGKQSNALKFTIRKDAWPFPVAPIEKLLENIPISHPRILVKPDKIEEFRSYKNKNSKCRKVYDTYITLAEEYVKKYNSDEINFKEIEFYTEYGPEYAEWGMYLQEFRRNSLVLSKICDTCAYAYLMSGKIEFAQVAKACLVSMSEWCVKRDKNGNILYDENGEMMYDPDGHTSYKNQDQVHRQITYRSAMAYDWIYDTLTCDEKRKILNMLKIRTEVMDYLMGSLSKSPYDSHGWTAFGYIGIIAVATYGELPKADLYLREIIPAYTAILPPWSYQDGGWSQGTDYWQYSTMFNQEFMDVLARAEIIDLYKEAWARNEYLWTMYAYPAGSYGSFGDQSNRMFPGVNEREPYSACSLMNYAYYNENPYALWLAEEIGIENDKLFDSYFTFGTNTKPMQPENYPLSHWFRDIGWVVMTDSLESRQRVQLTFKSSPYGSFNHSHPDQNAFIIQAYGENLAIKGGYYDAYHTIHDSTITRATFSHNTITVDGGAGQSDDNIHAKGYITSFANSNCFSASTGDATKAYNNIKVGNFTKTPYALSGELNKFTRSIIYIRPDIFITVDKLKAKDKSSFEWWINSEHSMTYTDNTTKIREGNACLDANILYPHNVSAKYYKGFVNPVDGKHYRATGRCLGANEHDKLCFATEKTDKTTIVSLMQVYKQGNNGNNFTVEETENVLKITIAGVTIYINLTDDTVEYKNIGFNGDATVISNDSIMLVNGSLLTLNKENIIKASATTTCILEKERISFTSIQDNDDMFNLEVNKNCLNLSEKYSITDVFGNSLDTRGDAFVKIFDNKFSFNALEGYYELLIN